MPSAGRSCLTRVPPGARSGQLQKGDLYDGSGELPNAIEALKKRLQSPPDTGGG